MKKNNMNAIRTLFVAICLILFCACKGQHRPQPSTPNPSIIGSTKKNKAMVETFDIEKFNKHQQANSYEFAEPLSGISVLQVKTSDGYNEDIKYRDSLFSMYKEYYLNGMIKTKGLSFINGSFPKGLWQTYDSTGKLIKEIDYDKWFKYGWEDILHFAKEHHIDLTAITTNIRRSWETGSAPEWWVTYKTEPNKNGDDIRILSINGTTGKITKEEWTRARRN